MQDYVMNILKMQWKRLEKVRAHRNCHALTAMRSESAEPDAEGGKSHIVEPNFDHDESWHDHYYELAGPYKNSV